MKKPLFTAILTAMCMSGFAQSVPIVFGDYNGDGELTVEDLAHIANMITGKEPRKLLIEGQFVDEVKVNSISLNPSSTLIYSGGSTTLTAIVSPEDATNKTLQWSSSNTSVATVENGVVHGIAEGSATITVTANDGSGETNSCSINVVTVTGVHNGYDYVDLGIKNADGNTIYWATCNVGASTPEGYGQFFAWGETVGYTSENASERVWNYTEYSLCNGSEYEITKYNSEDGKTVLDLVDDGARVNLGGSWRMPNQEEFELLVNNCDWVWTSINDVEGYMITSRTTSKSIFLPKAGYQGENFAPDWCYYWTSSLYTGSVAWHLANNQIGRAGMRCNGHSIRAVYVPEEASYISGSYSGHNYVDLGLPSGTLWATCNMGADAPEKYGDYYAWGETTPKTYYDWSTYQFGSSRDVSKYNVEDGLTRLESEDDAATVHWGEGWRIPTSSECQELLNNCSWLWKEVESAGELVQGVEFTGKMAINYFFQQEENGILSFSRLAKSDSIGHRQSLMQKEILALLSD